eukprot:COSAG03_NODE_599_length_6773_cov_6.193737_8_plen_66_part_00
MAQRSVWEVDTVRAQAKFLSITGAMKTVYYVLWRGFAAAAGPRITTLSRRTPSRPRRSTWTIAAS